MAYLFNPSEESTQCCYGPCRVHVESGAFLVAIFGTICCLLEALVAFSANHRLYTILPLLEAILVFIPIILAQRSRKHSFYWCYLIFELIAIILAFFLCIITIIFVSFYSKEFFKEIAPFFPDDTSHSYMRNIFALVVFFKLLIMMLKMYFYPIIWHAYKFMRNENELRNPPIA